MLLAALFALAQVTPAASAVPSPAPTGVLTVTPAIVNLNPAQQQIVAIGGAVAPLQLTLDRKLVTVTVDPAGTNVTITATQATGSDVLHVTDATGASGDVTIRVAFNAGTIVPQTTLTVTGDPAQPDWLAAAVTRWVTHLTQAMPGAAVTFGTVSAPQAPLEPGGSTQFVVPVQIAGNGQYFDQNGSTTVTVQNAPMQPFSPALLFYDDDPEHLTQDGVLFRGSISAAQPTRLYYYHDDAGDPRRLVVALQSASEVPAQVQLIDATAGPNADVMTVGQSVTKRFLLTKGQHEGIVLELSGDRPYLMTDLTMSARQLVAGTADVRVLSGGPVTVTVLGVSPGVDPVALLAGPVLEGDGHHRTGVFSIADFGTENLTYSAGSDDASTVLGDTDPTPPNVDTSAAGHDYGDYGVIHTIDLTLQNSSGAPSAAYLFLQPLAGPARASFLIGGNLVDVGCVRVPSRYQITAISVPPGQTSMVVQTMTDGGSFYPVRVGVTATPPIAAAPAITAPDGCFPKPQPAANR
ncbi:MAG TPA: hypothetical protein VGX91_06700 [Candidatus Cybelea sp.]|nr:hypothetical protein [Candidatus Cybelea sp.]